jgi:hypothetical protein
MPKGKLMKVSNPGRDWRDKGSTGQSKVQFDWGQAERTRCPLNAFQVAPGPGIEIRAINTRPIRGGLEGRQKGRWERRKDWKWNVREPDENSPVTRFPSISALSLIKQTGMAPVER